MRALGSWAPPVVVALLAGGCDPGAGVAAETLVPFFRAVQEHDTGGLYCAVAGAAEPGDGSLDAAGRRESFDAWLAERYADYERGRDLGRVELDEQGIVLVKLLALGRGTFFSYESVGAPAADVRVVETAIRFGYAHVDLSRLTPGTTFYICGKPVGRVHAVQVPFGPEEITVEALETVRVRWTLLRVEPAGGCPGGWTVASAEAVAGSETTQPVTWVF